MNWFTHTSGERRGIIALLVILALVIVLPAFFPEQEHEHENMEQFQNEIDAFYTELGRQAEEKENKNSSKGLGTPMAFHERVKPSAFAFDPNTADSAQFCALGFSPKQARAIINYRQRGKKFRTKEDFKSVFVVSDEMYLRLHDYIHINSAESLPLTASKDMSASPEESKPKLTTPSKVSLNTADTAEIKKLKAIGSYYAQRIVEYRNRLGGYHSVEQLMEIKGIDKERLSQFAEQVLIDTFYIKKIAINKLSEMELRKHPYMDAYLAKGIVSYRSFKGHIGSMQELVKERILKQEQATRLAPYLEY